jgi:hypothetical protein
VAVQPDPEEFVIVFPEPVQVNSPITKGIPISVKSTKRQILHARYLLIDEFDNKDLLMFS